MNIPPANDAEEVPDDAWAARLFMTDAPAEPVDDALRRSLERTLEAARRRRLRRRLLTAAIAAFAVIAAGATGRRIGREEARALSPERRAAPASSDSPPPARGESIADSDPFEIEARAAEAPLAERARLLRLAGDLHLTRDRDLMSATRCYGDYLRLLHVTKDAGADEDTWLLTAMRKARN